MACSQAVRASPSPSRPMTASRSPETDAAATGIARWSPSCRGPRTSTRSPCTAGRHRPHTGVPSDGGRSGDHDVTRAGEELLYGVVRDPGRPRRTAPWSWPLILLHVIRASRRAVQGDPAAWDRYWAGVTATGDGGDVLWDPSSSDEPTRYTDLLAAHADPALPVVDLGCGNGRFTRALAARFPRAVGTDLAASAVARARAESAGTLRCEFRVEDMTAPGTGLRLAGELGESNVFVRGVLHVLDAPRQHRLAAAIADLLGTHGTLLIAETNHPGPLLGYLQRLGAGASGLPPALERVLSAGLPRPAHFGRPELDRCFPAHRWTRLHTDASSTISTVPGGPDHRPTPVPAYIAVLRRNAVPDTSHERLG